MPCRRIQYRCDTTSTTSAAGSSRTCVAYQRNNVRAPSWLPPRITAGPAAIGEYLETGGRGRLLQSVKSHLGSRQFTGTVLFGYGFRDGLWPDAPDKRLLDAALPDRPVALVSADLHAVWLNSACLALVGRGDHPTGLVREAEGHEVLAALPEVPADTLDGWVADACRAAVALGVTGVIDFQYGDTVGAWERRSAQSAPAVRVSAAVYPSHLDAAMACRPLDARLQTGRTPIDHPPASIHVGSVASSGGRDAA